MLFRSWVLEQDQGLKLPKKLQANFSGHVQQMADSLGRELNAADIWQCFREAYYIGDVPKRFRLVDYEESKAGDGTHIFTGTILVDGAEQRISGRGKGLLSTILATMSETFGLDFEVLDYVEHALGSGIDARAAAYIECRLPDGSSAWGIGIDEDVATASVRAILSAANSVSARAAT